MEATTFNRRSNTVSEHSALAFNLGVASAITLASQTADIIAAGDGMTGPRDPVTVKALQTFAQEAANLLRAVPAADEEA